MSTRLEDNAASLVATILAYLPKIPAIFLAMRLMDVLGRRKLLKTFIPGLAACLFVSCLPMRKGSGDSDS